jgi:pilus assembly protein CpaE
MIAFVIHPDAVNPRVAALGDWLQKLGYSLIHSVSMGEAAEPKLWSGRDNIVVAPTTEEWSPRVGEVVSLAQKLVGRAFLLYVCDEISPESYKALLRTGAADCADWEHARDEISEISKRLKERESTAPTDASKHLIVGFLPAGGGVGNTTLALEMGVYFASRNGRLARRAAAVELDFHHATMCEHVDLEPRLDMPVLARNPERLDDYMLDVFRSRHSSGLDLFSTAQPRIDDSPVNAAAVFTLLGKLNDRYEILLLDFACDRPPWLDDALRNCDFIFVTGRQSVPSLRQVAREIRRLSELLPDRARVAALVTHCETDVFGRMAKKGDVGAALAGHRVFCVREDRSFALEAVNSGCSMIEMRAGSGICRDIQAAADSLRTLAPKELP